MGSVVQGLCFLCDVIITAALCYHFQGVKSKSVSYVASLVLTTLKPDHLSGEAYSWTISSYIRSRAVPLQRMASPPFSRLLRSLTDARRICQLLFMCLVRWVLRLSDNISRCLCRTSQDQMILSGSHSIKLWESVRPHLLIENRGY